jgi:hypothetical protein
LLARGSAYTEDLVIIALHVGRQCDFSVTSLLG